MNKKLFLSIATLAIVVVSGYNMYRANVNSVKLSELALANVEALTSDESSVSNKYEMVYYPQPGDDNYGYTKCVCINKNKDGDECCYLIL